MFEILIKRQASDDRQTLGEMRVLKGGAEIYACKTLELPWRDNSPQVSCIPAGTYSVSKRHSPKYGTHFHVLNVPNRSYILIHVGNYHSEIRGCILPGQRHSDINGDGYRDVTASRATMKKLLALLPAAGITLTIER